MAGRSLQWWQRITGLMALVVLPPSAGSSHLISSAEYRIEEREPSGDFHAPVIRVEDVTFDSGAGRWCFVNDSSVALACTDKAGSATQVLNRGDFEDYLSGQGVANPQLYVRETELIAYDAQGDRLYVGNNVNSPTTCNASGTGVEDLPALFRLVRSSPAGDWAFDAYWLLPSMNDCPSFPPLVFHYAGIIVVDGVVFFHTDRSFTSAGGESVVSGIYEFDLASNAFVDLDSPAFVYDTSGEFSHPRRLEYDAREGQVYVMEYSSSSPDEMRLLQIDWSSRRAVIESDLMEFGADPPASGFLHASRGVGVDSASLRLRIGNNDTTDPNSLLFVMSPVHTAVPALGPNGQLVLLALLSGGVWFAGCFRAR